MRFEVSLGLALAMFLSQPPSGTGGADDREPTSSPPAKAVAAGPADEATLDAPVLATAKISPDPSSIGDVLVLEIVAAHPKTVSVNLPIGLDFTPLHLVSTEESAPESTGQGLRKTFTIRLQHFDVGDAEVPAFPLTYVTADGQVETIRIPPTPFRVEPLLANEADPQRKGEDPPIAIEYPNHLAETIAYSVLGTLAFALGLWLALRRFMRRRRPEVVIPPIPPHERALAGLTALEGEGLPDQGLFQDFYLRLTEIVREYLEGRFGIEALDRTTDEIRRQLLRQENRLAPLRPTELVRFLQQADLVKFARVAPTIDETTSSMAYARSIVEQTKSAMTERAGGEQRPAGESREVA